ncbi:hypothetical protein [Asticcacaulis sp. AC402]|uniref:hypothetical protein n=1 Tax=Asticcacaulis sp. AC402 TaxID=1282361 RepID=UPI0012DF4A50|nr:hypothetical protein [Asticcacaulis sp. AC402]
MVDDDRSQLVIELAKTFIELAMEVDSSWTKAYFRFSHEGNRLGSNASCVSNGVVNLVSPFQHDSAWDRLNEISENLFQEIGKPKAVILLIVDNEFNFDVKFEYDDMRKWTITKIDGATGVPEGF